MHFKNDVWHNIEKIIFFDIKIIKEFQIMKGLLNENNSIISKLDGHKKWAITFVKIY